ncbi:MAG: LLM class flavin-dependent oxidoreductase [Sphaerobacter sp.]|nr:LLM class flavin-dependent oxidoreductase [Sphaerobacter sp.]
MPDLGHELWFGCFLIPDARQAEGVVALARLADSLGLDLIGVQDHPYNPGFLDMWTLLSTLAAETERIRLVPDVVNLPLRPPATLARAVASLDILSGGRVELGLGAGASAEAIATMGGPRRDARAAVEALTEAIAVIRALWTPGPAVRFAGQHYQLDGARPGPFPVHPVGIWVGAYRPRMLRLTGALADGWIPSSMYAPPSEVATMTRVVDDAARAAGRDPSAIRRVYNIAGRFAPAARGFLDGPPGLWVEQLTELVLEHGFSAFVLAPGQDPVTDLRRFAEEVAPGVREAVAAARQAGTAGAARPAEAAAVRLESAGALRRTAPAPRSRLLDEDSRPRLPKDPNAPVTAVGRANQETLLAVHDHLRQELAEIRDVAARVAAGRIDPAAARGLLNRLTMRQNYWTLGAFCAQYCRIVSLHHTIEDRRVFPNLRREDESLAAVLERLTDEHEVIAEVLDRLDRALGAMITDPEQVEGVQRIVDDLTDVLLSHLAYEEDELLEPLGRSSFPI